MTTRKRGREEQVSADTIREARDTLNHLLQRVAEGTMTAPPGLVARLEGAIAALDAILAEPVPKSAHPSAE